MDFLKDIFEKLIHGDSSEKLSTMSDLIQVITFFTAIILSPKILSLFYNKFNDDTYYGIIIATTFSILIITLFLLLLSLLVQAKTIYWTNKPTTLKLLYFACHVILWGLGLAIIPVLIKLFYEAIIW